MVPSARPSEAAQALKDFTEAYNKADKAFDPKLDAGRVTGALGAINQAGLTSGRAASPQGNPRHQPLELTDAKYAIPKKAGWPRWFVADTDSNRDVEGGRQDNRWVLVFLRNGPDQPWKAAYLTILTPDEIPVFKKDKDGWATAVRPDTGTLVVPPGDLAAEYASYLDDGQPEHFADGPHTNVWRRTRAKTARVPGLTTQYIDQPLSGGDFAPLGLVTEDGSALVFFATRRFERATAAKGYRPRATADVRGLTTGEVKDTLTKEWVSNQAVQVPRRGAPSPLVVVSGRLEGVVAAKGS